jgi:hypothetical protein
MMKIRISVLTLIFLLVQGVALAQQSPYVVTRTPFSTDNYDEFAPVFFGNGLVFCSDRGQAVNSQGQAVVKMFFADTAFTNKKAQLFSKDLKSKLNDGPATFNREGDTIYYSRNLVVEGNLKMLSTYRNKLGLFYSVYEDKGWGRIRELRFNTEWFNITMPCLSHDSKRLYFASDKPDGFGGLDIYYSNWRNGYWEDPVNLGPDVNTEGNETYPFISETGELFFTSDGRDGLGGKDIYVTKEKEDGWYTPVRLAAPINSEYDDFGIVATATMDEGYFSSGRGKSVDIYRFTSTVPQVWFAEPQKENIYCFAISDSGNIDADTLMFRYVWDFGDNTRMYGRKVQHCFPGPGTYHVTFDIVDLKTGNIFFRKRTYDIEIIDYNQPYISSVNYPVTGENVGFDGMKSYCPGYTITGFFWDFGDGTQETGAGVSHAYTRAGDYDVRLGLTMRSRLTGDMLKRSVTKRVKVFPDSRERELFLDSFREPDKEQVDLRMFENVTISNQYSAEDDFRKEAVFQVEVLSSKTRMDLNNPVFRSVPPKYTVREVFYPETGTYSYIIDQQMTLMATYPAYSEMVSVGYKGATVRLFVLKEPVEKELNVLKRNYGVMTDTYFDSRNRLVTNAYLMLDQVVILMNKYPDLKLEVGIHTDNQGSIYTLQNLSQLRAQVIVDYLTNRGVSASRLVPKGYGGTRPVAPNETWLERRLNRRVEFTVIR